MAKPAVKRKALAKRSDPVELDPRQALFLAAYIDPKSKTFGNALQSALSAGYSQEYAESITAKMPDWLAENVGKERRVKRAEEHLDEVLEMPIVTQAMGAFGPIYEKRESFVKKKLQNGKTKMVRKVDKVPVMTFNTSRIKEKSKVVEFTLERLDRKNYGKQEGNKFGFVFNIGAVREKYRTQP